VVEKMDLKRIHIIIISSVVILLISVNIVTLTLLLHSPKNGKHPPILINNDADFDRYNFPGKGSIDKPYIISNYYITTHSSSGIAISGTTKYFVIRDCSVQAQEKAISIVDIADGTAKIENNICLNAVNGIYLSGASNSSISKNLCKYNENQAILIYKSNFTDVIENTCTNNYFTGIYLTNSHHLRVTDNVCNFNSVNGIDSDDCTNVIISNNECYHNYRSFLIDNDGFSSVLHSNVTLTNNRFFNNDIGIQVEQSKNIFVENNICNNGETGFLFIDCSNLIFISNMCDNNTLGIDCRQLTNSSLSFNQILNNQFDGISLSGSNNTIHQNTFLDNNLEGFSQASDMGLDNMWYSEILHVGNLWSDWVSGPYNIGGSAGSIDLYPLYEIRL
jgi:parallel beta-helix repeat protein